MSNEYPEKSYQDWEEEVEDLTAERDGLKLMLDASMIALDTPRRELASAVAQYEKLRKVAQGVLEHDYSGLDETTLNRMAQRFYEVAGHSEGIFVNMTAKPAIVEGLRAALALASEVTA